MRLLNKLLNTPASGQDASVDFESVAGLLAHAFSFSIQVIISGTTAGTIKLQGSSDPVPDANFPPSGNWVVSNWTDIDDTSEPVTGAGSIMYNYRECPGFNWVRVVYTVSSGTGTMIIRFNTKGM